MKYCRVNNILPFILEFSNLYCMICTDVLYKIHSFFRITYSMINALYWYYSIHRSKWLLTTSVLFLRHVSAKMFGLHLLVSYLCSVVCEWCMCTSSSLQRVPILHSAYRFLFIAHLIQGI